MSYTISIDEITNNILFENDMYMFTIEKAIGTYNLYQFYKKEKKEYFIMHDENITILIDYISKEK